MKIITLESVIKQITENSVKKLDLTRCEPSVPELKQILNALNGNTSIVLLDLGENPLSSEQDKTASEYTKALADFIAENKKILFLKLGVTKLQDNDCIHLVKALGKNTTLMSLELSYNNISFRGAKALSELLTQNSTLLSLDVRVTPLGISGLEALYEGLDSNKTLVDLALGENDMDEADLIEGEVAKILEENRKHFEEKLQSFPIIPKEIIDIMNAQIASGWLYNPFIKIYNFQNAKNKSAAEPVTFSTMQEKSTVKSNREAESISAIPLGKNSNG
jgi:hypothetical protein